MFILHFYIKCVYFLSKEDEYSRHNVPNVREVFDRFRGSCERQNVAVGRREEKDRLTPLQNAAPVSSLYIIRYSQVFTNI